MSKQAHVCCRGGRLTHTCVRAPARGRGSFTLPGLAPDPPPPSPPDPDPLSQRDAPSLIAARHTEAICSNEARRHGDAVRLFGFAVDCPAEK